jgi:hypothetical protein
LTPVLLAVKVIPGTREPANVTPMAARPIAQSLSLLLAFVASCGSRTPLEINPTDASDEIVRDSGPDRSDASDAENGRCIAGTRPVGPIPIDLYFTLDRSKSMDTIDRGATMTRWEAISAAMNTFINSPLSVGLGAGIAFFPRNAVGGGAYCTAADYAFPVVPIGALPGVAPSITKAISLQTRGQGTPMTAALEGAHIYARREQTSSPDHTTAVIVVTDGMPRDCGNTITSTAAVASAAITGTPIIRTYVLGVGPNLSNLNAIAQAGGSSQAYLVESSGEASLLAALEAIRTSALACEYELPLVDGALPPLDDVRVSTRLGNGGTADAVGQVASAEACAGNAGWFFDNPAGGSAMPTKILLCPASCAPLVATPDNHLDVAINCTAP